MVGICWDYDGNIQNIWGYEDLVGYNDGNMNGISHGNHMAIWNVWGYSGICGIP
jgi:hypothetical protein